LQRHVEDQEIQFEKLNNKIGLTDLALDGDFDTARLTFTDSALDAAQESVLDILPEEGVDNGTIELTNTNDVYLLTMQSKLQDKHNQQDHHNQHMLCQVQLLQLLDNCNAPLYHFDDIIWWTRGASIIHNYDFEQPAPSRRFIVKDLIQRNNIVPCLPKVIQLQLPSKAGG
jgi:hypothetical protein